MSRGTTLVHERGDSDQKKKKKGKTEKPTTTKIQLQGQHMLYMTFGREENLHTEILVGLNL